MLFCDCGVCIGYVCVSMCVCPCLHVCLFLCVSMFIGVSAYVELSEYAHTYGSQGLIWGVLFNLLEDSFSLNKDLTNQLF